MPEDKVIPLKNPGTPAPVADAQTELLREGAQRMLAAAIESEVAAFVERFKDEKTAEGRQRVVRNGHLPTRSLQTGVGAVEVTVPRVRDRAKTIRCQQQLQTDPPGVLISNLELTHLADFRRGAGLDDAGFALVLEPVTVPLDLNDMGMVQQPVE
jgi:hypothetical protein